MARVLWQTPLRDRWQVHRLEIANSFAPFEVIGQLLDGPDHSEAGFVGFKGLPYEAEYLRKTAL